MEGSFISCMRKLLLSSIIFSMSGSYSSSNSFEFGSRECPPMTSGNMTGLSFRIRWVSSMKSTVWSKLIFISGLAELYFRANLSIFWKNVIIQVR